MSTANKGDKVKVHYKVKTDDGKEVASTQEEGPMEIEIGKGEIWPSIETALVGMALGDKKSINLPSEEGIPYVDELIFDLPTENMPKELTVEIGSFIQLQDQGGQVVVAKVLEISEDKIKVDSNHPLAGQSLTIDVELSEIL